MVQRRIFVGDLHGCRGEFEALLEALRYDPVADGLYPVGDFVNRGPDSVGTLRAAREAGAQPVLGNHDVHLLRQAADPGLRGNRDTLNALRAADDGEELLAWLGAQPLVRGWDDVILVHAGIHPSWSDPVAWLDRRSPFDPADHAVEFAVRARHCDPEGRLAPRELEDDPPPPAPYRPWDDYWRARTDETRTVVFGHWARRGLVELERTIGLDSGCLYGGELTAWIPEEDRLVSVPARKVWFEPG